MSCTWRPDDEGLTQVAALFAGAEDPAPLLPFAEPTYAHALEGLFVPFAADVAPAPRLLVLQDDLAGELGADPARLRSPAGLALLLGAGVPGTVAQGYAGHQFGGFSPRLGDGRALLLGEVVDRSGGRRDIHLKGSGRTPFARAGDGKAAVGPMLREHVVSEALHALGIPTTRALAVIATGEDVRRETSLPGAVLVRVAASHLRVGTFEYVAHTLRDRELLQRLLTYAIERHHPGADGALGLLDAVVAAQAKLVAQWMLVGFVHGVMNTDNMTISGETIDFGPCAFMERYDPQTVFSSIDHGGRYAYGNQPAVAQWNLARLAEALLALIDDDAEAGVRRALPVLETFAERFDAEWGAGMQAKLGLTGRDGIPQDLVNDLLALLRAQSIDWTSAFRALAQVARGDAGGFAALATEPDATGPWVARWLALLPDAEAMDRVNPAVIPRNAAVEDALNAATGGDLAPYERLVAAVRQPFTPNRAYADPAPRAAGEYVTYCGT